jgi:ElaB/YqjD/DUF883 family membrane-anchored ribosome-binding protein
LNDHGILWMLDQERSGLMSSSNASGQTENSSSGTRKQSGDSLINKDAVQEKVRDVKDSARQMMERGRDQAEELGRSLEERIRERPLQSVLIAGGVGILLGAILCRR